MRKLSVISLLLIAALVLTMCMAACGNKPADNTGATQAATEVAATTAPTEASTSAPTLAQPLGDEEMMIKVLEANGLTTETAQNITAMELDQSVNLIEYEYDGKKYSFKINKYTGEIAKAEEAAEVNAEESVKEKAGTKAFMELSEEESEADNYTAEMITKDGKDMVKVEFDTVKGHYKMIYDPETDSIIEKEFQ